MEYHVWSPCKLCEYLLHQTLEENDVRQSVIFIGPASWCSLALVDCGPNHCEEYDDESTENENIKRQMFDELVEVFNLWL